MGYLLELKNRFSRDFGLSTAVELEGKGKDSLSRWSGGRGERGVPVEALHFFQGGGEVLGQTGGGGCELGLVGSQGLGWERKRGWGDSFLDSRAGGCPMESGHKQMERCLTCIVLMWNVICFPLAVIFVMESLEWEKMS